MFKSPTLDIGPKYFFVHIPKTGGTSLFNWISGVYGHENCCEHIEDLVLPAPSAETLDSLREFRLISGHVPIDWWSYFSDCGFEPITIIRNPIDQFYSHIHHLLAQDADSLARQGVLGSIREKLEVSVGYFLEAAEADELEFLESPQSKPMFGGNYPWRTASVDERIAWLQDVYSAVMLTETMNVVLASQVNVHTRDIAGFPRINARPHGRAQLTARQKRVLWTLLKEDIALYKALFETTLAI